MSLYLKLLEFGWDALVSFTDLSASPVLMLTSGKSAGHHSTVTKSKLDLAVTVKDPCLTLPFEAQKPI